MPTFRRILPNEFQTSPLRFPRYLGKRALSATACWRRNASSIKVALDLVGKVGVRHVPCLRTSLVGRFVWRSHSSRLPLSPDFTLSTLVYFLKTQASPCPCLQVCDPPTHWVTSSYRWSPYLLKPYQTFDPSLVCRLKKALYGLKQARKALSILLVLVKPKGPAIKKER